MHIKLYITRGSHLVNYFMIFNHFSRRGCRAASPIKYLLNRNDILYVPSAEKYYYVSVKKMFDSNLCRHLSIFCVNMYNLIPIFFYFVVAYIGRCESFSLMQVSRGETENVFQRVTQSPSQ